MFILGSNAAGLLNKKESFLRNIAIFKPAAYLIQESKLTQKNQVLVDDYVIFEHVRKHSGGGGVLTAVHKELNPISVSDEIEGEEIVVVEATTGGRKLRLINGYGPQETETEETRRNFFSRLDLEIKRAKMSGSLICIEMDSNSKLGPHLVPDDPHPQSANGKLLESVIKENNLKVVNGSTMCSGTITRKRTTVNGTEESVIDHFIVCSDMFSKIVKLQIDEEKKYCLTKYTNRAGSRKYTTESDHNTLILEIDKKWKTFSMNTGVRTEILNYKNKENFKTFIDITNNNDKLRQFFNDPNEDLEAASKAWIKCLKLILKACFDKIRLKKYNIKPELQLLFQEKEFLKSKIARLENENKFEEAQNEENKLDDINKKIADICAERNKAIVDEYLSKTDDTIEGYNQTKT